MKEKNKKILKGLGVGALACIGMVGLTGCANVDVSQNKVDSLIERFEEHTNKTTKEEIVNLCKTAYYDSLFQRNGYENVVITEDHSITNYYSNSTMSMCARVDKNSVYVLYFDNTSQKLVNAEFVLWGDEYLCIDKETSSAYPLTKYDNYCHPAYFLGLEGVEVDNYKVLENGNVSVLLTQVENYEVVEYGEEYTAFKYYDIEITKDAKLVSLNWEMLFDIDFEYDQEMVDRYDMFVDIEPVIWQAATYSYGTADVELMQELYELAQAAEETPEEDEE